MSAVDTPSSAAPAKHHAEGLARFTALAVELERKSKRTSTIRLIVFLSIIGVGVLCYDLALSYAFTLAPLAAFVALVFFHERVERSRKDALARARFHQGSVHRLRGSWPTTGASGDRFFDEAHPYARDLDLFGAGSLFELLCRAETPWGEAELARWLQEAAELPEIEKRQREVRALAESLDFREELAAAGARTRRDLDDQPQGFKDAEGLAAWAGGRADFSVPLVAIFFLVVAANIGLTLGWAFWTLSWLYPVGSVVLSLALSRPFARQTHAALEGATRAEPALGPLAEVLAVAGAAPLDGEDLGDAAPAVKKLAAYAHRANAMRNPFFLPFGLALGWREWSAVLVERWRRKHGGRVQTWLNAIGRLEALASLAAFAWEQDTVFPDIDEDRAYFHAAELGHPLLTGPIGGVRNEVELDEVRLFVVSGSNMSGKSTLLRAIGCATVTALAGGPVLAKSCALGRMTVAASIALHDSIQSGESRFYAELLRLKQIVELAEAGPALYLLDELLSGTNSHDRQLGAAALMKRLLETGAVGLVTTHDLSLTENLDERARNVHLQDELQEGKLVFDYTLKEGVVTRSNARDLMREVGLL